MLTRDDLCPWILDALRRNNRRATILQVAKDIWDHHASELQASGDLLYKWQYDMRWAAQKLRDARKLRHSNKGVWELV
jgi:hypothetical protein